MLAGRRTLAPDRRILNAHTLYRTGSPVTALAYARATFPTVTRFDLLDDAGPFEIHSRAVDIGGIRLMAVSTAGHRITLEDHHRLGLLIPFAGRIGTDDGRREATVERGALLLPGLGRRTTTCGPDYEGLVVILPTTMLEKRLDMELGHSGSDLLHGLGAIGGGATTAASLVDFVRCVVRDIDRAGLLATSAAARSSACQLLLDYVASVFLERGEAANRVAPAASASAFQVAKAEAFIRANLGDPLSIANIAAAVGTSSRSLQLAFRRHRDTTPRAYLQACRLDLLHRRLAGAAPGTRVTDVAVDCGMSHLGRCAGAYRQRFGERPSETLAKALRRA